MLMLLLDIFCMLCGSLFQARDLEKHIRFNRFYETEQPASCAHAKQQEGRLPPPLLPPPPQLFICSLTFIPQLITLCLHLCAFVKTVHLLLLPLCFCSQFISNLIKAVLLYSTTWTNFCLKKQNKTLLTSFLCKPFSFFHWVWKLWGRNRPS